jgi:hypothetical protein
MAGGSAEGERKEGVIGLMGDLRTGGEGPLSLYGNGTQATRSSRFLYRRGV